jgi:hypothetical protein
MGGEEHLSRPRVYFHPMGKLELHVALHLQSDMGVGESPILITSFSKWS